MGPGVRVGIYAERSPETLVGMLAVLMAGGAFLPLDPDYPVERLALILDDARVPVLLARPGLAATACRPAAPTLVPLDGGEGSPRPAGGFRDLAGASGRTTSPTSSTPPARPGAPRGC